MKIKTQELLNALKSLSPITRGKSLIPIQSCVRLESADHLSLTVFNFDEFMVRRIGYEGEIMSACVNFNHLMNCLGPAGETMLIKQDSSIVITCGSKISRLSLIDVKDFPDLPEISKFIAIGVSTTDLAAGLRVVHGFEHIDRHPLDCTRLFGSFKRIECAACDGLQLALHSQLLISGNFEILVPSQFCDNLADALEGKESIFSQSENMLHVKNEGSEYFCKKGEGKWLDFTAFLNGDFKTLGTIDSKLISDELVSMLAFRDQNNAPQVNLEFTPGELWMGFTGPGSLLENRLPGEFQEAKCVTNGESFLKCLKPFSGKITISDSQNMLKFEAGDLRVFMGKMRP